jgi:hypothetical protein
MVCGEIEEVGLTEANAVTEEVKNSFIQTVSRLIGTYNTGPK